MKKGIFITGTDTNVGKTFVSSLLVSSLRANKIATGYFKPIQTGTDSNTPSDLQTVIALSELSTEEQTPSVYSFPQPMSPNRAASLNGKTIELEPILDHWNTLQNSPLRRTWIVEGAGGLLVPFNSKQTMRDLILALDLSTILVASTRLGTINHTLLSLEMAQSSGIHVSGLVLVGHKDPGLDETLRCFTQVPILAEIPWLPEITSSTLRDNCLQYFTAHTLNQIFCPLTERSTTHMI
jgi:dethiobiotin synthetase